MSKTDNSQNDINEITRLILPLAQSLHRAADAPALDRLKVPVRQMQALLVLSGESALETGELARRLSIAASTASELVNRMESGGLVKRRTSLDDRRKISVSTTAKGNKKAADYKHAMALALADKLEVLSGTEQRSLLDAFKTIIRILDGLDSPESDL